MITYHTYKPSVKLSEYVRYYWSLEGNASVLEPYFHRTFANVSPELIFHYKGSFEELGLDQQLTNSFISGIHGQTNQSRRFLAKSNFGIFGVYLQPISIPALFYIPSLIVKNEMPGLDELLGNEGEIITDQMLHAENDNRRVQVMNEFLENRINGFSQPAITYSARAIIESKGQVNVKTLAAKVCISQRHFERKFKENIGFSPKTFSRIARFNALLNNYRNTNLTLSEIAYKFGYYDQAHFIRDFREFSGYNPKIYFSGNANEAFYTC